MEVLNLNFQLNWTKEPDQLSKYYLSLRLPTALTPISGYSFCRTPCGVGFTDPVATVVVNFARALIGVTAADTTKTMISNDAPIRNENRSVRYPGRRPLGPF